MKAARRVFDAHFHIGPYGNQTAGQCAIRPIPPEVDHADGAACCDYLTRHGIRGGLVVPTYVDDQRVAFEYNHLLPDAFSAHDGLYGGLWVSPLPEVEPQLDETLRLLPHGRIRALKIASNTWLPFGIDPSTWSAKVRRNVERILEAAKHHDLVIHLHTGHLEGARPAEFEAFMREYGPSATFQLVHMGESIVPTFDFVPRFIDWIRRGLAVYTDTSLIPGFGPSWLVSELDRLNLGCNRVLFATDAPWGRFESEYWKVAAMDVTDAVLDQLFWANAAVLYRLKE